MKNILTVIAGLALSLAGASAQNSSLEFMGGWSVQPYTIKGDAGSAPGAFNGSSAFLRYTYFFPGDWGISVQLGSEAVFGSEGSFFGAMNKADGGKYLYRFDDSGTYDSVLTQYSVGAAYRWDSGMFRFTPRLSFGVGEFSGYDYSYERRSRSGSSGPEYFSFSPVRKTVTYDYLIDKREDYISPAVFLVSADFQITANFGRLYLFMQPGITIAPVRINVEHSKCGSVPAYNPSNWAEALAWSGLEGSWTRDYGSTVTSVEPAYISPFLHLNLGVGINLGYRKHR